MSKDKPTVDIDNGYQNEEISQQAFYLRTHVQVLCDELEIFKELVDKSDPPPETREWLYRVYSNLSKSFRPSMDNLDQVRFVLDKQGQGLPE